MIRLLTVTNLYPSDARPRHGIFVEQRLRQLVASGRVQASVIVPVPCNPFRQRVVSVTAACRNGIPVRYSSFPFLPALTTLFHPVLMARAARRAIATFDPAERNWDVVDGQFLYPDGVAAMRVARELGKPAVLTARGSDVYVALAERIAGRSIRRAAETAAAIIAVSSDLRDRMSRAGLPVERIMVLRNGVDLDLFRPGDRVVLRSQLDFKGPTLLVVGNLVREKGHDLALRALGLLPGASLVVLGQGSEEGRLKALAWRLGVAGRVRWLAPVPHDELAQYYAAADLTALTSTREGMPNVLLESLACGTPVVATAVGGAVEVITAPVAGRLVHDRAPESFAKACREVLNDSSDRGAVRRHAERFGWAETVAGQVELLERIVAAGRA